MALQVVNLQTLTGASPTWDNSLGVFAKHYDTSVADVVITITNISKPDGGVLHFKQNAGGTRTLTINGQSITVKTGANAITRVDFSYDGVNIVIISYLTSTVYTVATTTLITLSTPTLTAGTPTTTTVPCTCTNVANESGYQWEKSADNSTWTVDGTTGANVNSYTFTGLPSGTLYYFRVKAIGDGTTYDDSGYGTASATTVSSSFIASVNWATYHDPARNLTTSVSGSDTLVSKMRDQMHLASADPSPFDMIQNTSANQPKLIASAVNGKPMLETGGSRFMSTGTFGTITLAKPFTRILVFKLTATPTAVGILAGFVSASARADFYVDANKKPSLYAGAFLPGTTTLVSGAVYILLGEFQGDGATDKLYLYYNGGGGLEATGNAGTSGVPTGLMLGFDTSANNPAAYQGRHFLYNGIFSSGDKNSLITELKTDYGLS